MNLNLNQWRKKEHPVSGKNHINNQMISINQTVLGHKINVFLFFSSDFSFSIRMFAVLIHRSNKNGIILNIQNTVELIPCHIHMNNMSFRRFSNGGCQTFVKDSRVFVFQGAATWDRHISKFGRAFIFSFHAMRAGGGVSIHNSIVLLLFYALGCFHLIQVLQYRSGMYLGIMHNAYMYTRVLFLCVNNE